MTETDLSTSLTEIEKDIEYFKNLGFTVLSEKFKRDLTIIKELLKDDKNISESK